MRINETCSSYAVRPKENFIMFQSSYSMWLKDLVLVLAFGILSNRINAKCCNTVIISKQYKYSNKCVEERENDTKV